MKFRKFGQIVLASVVSLGLATGITACTYNRIVDYVYIASAKNNPGSINAYKVDYTTGALRPMSGSPFATKYTSPVSIVVSPNYKYLYVAFQGSNLIQQFTVADSGQITAGNTYTVPGTAPVGLAINAAGTYLYAVETYQPSFSSSTPGPGALVVYPVGSDGSLGTAVSNGSLQYYPVGMNPTAVAVTANNSNVFVASRTSDGSAGAVYAYSVGSGGALTALGSSALGAGIISAGIQPSAIATDLSSNYVYVTDYTQNELLGYTIHSTGLVAMANSPFKTGNQPKSVVIDPRNKYVYVTNFTDATVTGYQLDSVTGTLTTLSGGTTAAAAESQATCAFIEPALGRYVYVTNYLANSVSGFKLNPNSGALTTNQGSPVEAASGPTCGVAVPHGNHSTQLVDTGN
jgi:6-phosphogluconolactonase (cycloisomerase 2 family)